MAIARRPGAVLMALLLGACNPPAAPEESVAPQVASNAFPFTCEAFAEVDGATLAQRFGAENISEEIDHVEGEPYPITVVFANDAARRITLTWRDTAGRTGVESVSISGGESDWTGPAGLRLGQTLGEVEAINGGPFLVAGFGWDYGGWTRGWEGGVLERQSCRVSAGFTPHPDVRTEAIGDTLFASNTQAMRDAEPRVYELTLRFGEQG